MLDGVTINQLRAFVAVCDEASFSGASRKLQRAQSAISHSVAALESTLAVALFERGARRPELSAAGRSLLADARAVIARVEEMKTRARAISKAGPQRLSIAVDSYFPRARLIACLKLLEARMPAVAITLRTTTMQAGEALLLDDVCALAVTIFDVPELNSSAIERHWLCETRMATVCGPSHPLASAAAPVAIDEFARHVQIVVTDNQPGAEKTRKSVVGERNWLVTDLATKHDFLRAGLGWGHMPVDLVAGDLAAGTLVDIRRRAWHLPNLIFVVSRRRGHDLSEAEVELIDLLSGRMNDRAGAARPRPLLPRETDGESGAPDG
jgi:DNA-binding transcriptional LysR family regulator